MEMKTEALKLADELDEASELEADLNRPENEADFQKASAMIRRLVEELDECWCGGHSYAYLRAKGRLPQTKPLSDEEICELWLENSYGLGLCNIAFEYARAIKERHGIK